VKGSADRNSAEEVRNILDLVICFSPLTTEKSGSIGHH
jgi:hypothetical protein